METTLRVFLNRFFLAVLCFGIIALICSLLAAYAFDLIPCTLCKLQRIPYTLLAANACLGLVSGFKEGFYRIVLCCLAMGVALGITHFLMQMGMVPDFCSSQKGFSSPEKFLNMLQSPKCFRVNWSILGVPVSLLNAVLHGSVLGISVRLKPKKKLIRGAL